MDREKNFLGKQQGKKEETKQEKKWEWQINKSVHITSRERTKNDNMKEILSWYSRENMQL